MRILSVGLVRASDDSCNNAPVARRGDDPLASSQRCRRGVPRGLVETRGNEVNVLKPFLRRYTELPFLVDFLHTKQLTLLRPINWDDTNDAYYINQYAQHRHPALLHEYPLRVGRRGPHFS